MRVERREGAGGSVRAFFGFFGASVTGAIGVSATVAAVGVVDWAAAACICFRLFFLFRARGPFGININLFCLCRRLRR